MSATTKGLLFDSIRKFPSPEILNVKCVIWATGDLAQTIDPNDLEDSMLLSVTENSTDSALRKGVVYIRNNGNWESINAGTHNHKSANDGGKLVYAFTDGAYDLWHRNYQNPEPFKNITTSTNGSASMNTSGFLRLTANSGLANNVINCYDRGLTFSFADVISFFARLKLTSVSTNYVTRFTMNGEPAETASPSNEQEMTIEGCDTCNTNKVSIVSADGTNRIKDDTVITDLVTDIANYMMVCYPTLDQIIYKRNDSTYVVKDDAIPSTGLSTRTRNILAGLQTTNTTSKTMDIYGFIANGKVGETSWNDINTT